MSGRTRWREDAHAVFKVKVIDSQKREHIVYAVFSEAEFELRKRRTGCRKYNFLLRLHRTAKIQNGRLINYGCRYSDFNMKNVVCERLTDYMSRKELQEQEEFIRYIQRNSNQQLQLWS